VYTIALKKINEVYFRVDAEPCILAEMSEHFTFKVPGAHFQAKYKARIWDGRIRLLNRMNNTIYRGLIGQIKKFAKDREYELEYDESNDQISESEVNDYIKLLKLPFEVRDYQFDCFKTGIENKRALFLSPTASGKSMVIYLLTRFFVESNVGKALIIVPTLNLIAQMKDDFINYSKEYDKFLGINTEELIHEIYSGQDKKTDKPIVISTWQSLYELREDFFSQFGFVLVDEAHGAKADSLKKILTRCTHATWRFGTTGTLDGTKCNAMVIEGLTGPIHQATTTKKLMDDQKLATLKINCIVLRYNEEERKQIKKFGYQDELQFIVAHTRRNKFIRNLAISQKGNTLVLFQYVAKHGMILHQLIKEKAAKGRKVCFVYGGTEIEQRESARAIIEKETNAIIVASVGVFSTGVNMPNLDVVIFASPCKSRIRTLQSIGRVLRKGRTDKATLYDVIDDLQHKKRMNFALKHFIERVNIYDQEELDYHIYKVEL
jgi:superfamily II DNA or RNA helicase